ncbi:uncharacterized protein F5147DRAFT_656157 [Suillus discolor]|uniref:Uncharacterized protein n=1 Tax=Suillus discolor TaxID=1912936 RepID=A0A9P7EYK4_9AGAM|nr:uncharacterized protein F5147DRAFT_656157 [Suillus discolor]KAG2098277.1 hypothetical protein F5147DRAFT_656157 [Suillus discolor]
MHQELLKQQKEQIHEEIEEEPGQKEVLRRYQPMMTAIMKELNENELKEAQVKADEWTNQAPDATVQAKTAKKKGEKMIKHFTKEMFTQASMRLFVLGSWKDEKGSLLTSGQVDSVNRSVRFDFNEHLGMGSSFMKCKDWPVILLAWEDFIIDAFNQDQDQDGTLLGGTRRVLKPYDEFDLDHMGLPMLPNIEDVSLNTKKGMIQSFLTIHYHKPVDRKSAASSDARYHRNMLWKTKGPSALEQHNEGTINDKGKMHPPVGEESEESDGDADDEGMWPRPTKASLATTALSLVGIAKQQPRLIKRVHVSSAEEESNNTDAGVSCSKVNARAPDCARQWANAQYSDQVGHQSESDDQPLPKSLGKRVRIEPAIVTPSTDSTNEDQPMDHVPCKTGATRDASLVVNDRSLKKTKATRDVSLAVNDWSPKKTKAIRSVVQSLSDAPAKSTRSKVDNALGAQIRQKPKRYADYV